MAQIVGQKIVEARKMTESEMRDEYWTHGHAPTVLVLENGTKLFPSQDEEGNGPGALFGTDEESSFALL